MANREKEFTELAYYIVSRFEVDRAEYKLTISFNRDAEGYIEVRSKDATISFTGTIDKDFDSKIDKVRGIFTEIDKYIQSMINNWR